MISKGISGRSRGELAAITGRGLRLVHVDDAARALGVDRAAAAKKLARWARQGWLRRVRQGLYIPVPVDVEYPALWSEDPLILADEVWAPCYFTGWTAANHWGLTEQIFRTTVVRTSSRVRQGREKLLEHEYLLSHVDESAMRWGLRRVWRQERGVRMAEPARAIIDSLDDPRLGGGIRHVSEMLEAYLAEHEWQPLVDYGDRVGNRTVFKRLGRLAAVCTPAETALLEEARRRLPSGVTLLDPTAPPRGQLDHEWRLRINVHLDPFATS